VVLVFRITQIYGLLNAVSTNDTFNEGLLRRQKLVNKYSDEKQAVLGGVAINKMEAKSYVDNSVAGAKYIYYDVVLRLKDLCPNFFQNFPLALGVKFKITLTLNNNISFQFRKIHTGYFIYDFQSFGNVTICHQSFNDCFIL